MLKTPGMGEIHLDQLEMLLITGRHPDPYRFARKTAIGKTDDKRRTGPQNTGDFGKDFHRPDQILHRYSAQHGIETGALEGQARFLIQVVNNKIVELRIVLHLLGIEAEADDALDWQIGRQMGAIATHQVEHNTVRGDMFVKQLAKRLDRGIVDMHRQPRIRIKECVVTLVITCKEILGKILRNRQRAPPHSVFHTRVKTCYSIGLIFKKAQVR